MKKMKFKREHLIYIIIVAGLAIFMYNLDVDDGARQISLQRTRLVDGACMYYDGSDVCAAPIKYCDSSGKEVPISMGFCNNMKESRATFNRAAIGDSCTSNDDCDSDEACQAIERNDDGDIIEGECIDPENPPNWSTAEFDEDVTSDIKEKWNDLTGDWNIKKVYLWFALFIAMTIISLYLVTPPKYGGVRN